MEGTDQRPNEDGESKSDGELVDELDEDLEQEDDNELAEEVKEGVEEGTPGEGDDD